ncbi:hypothetical protein [Dyella sp. KULCS107]
MTSHENFTLVSGLDAMEGRVAAAQGSAAAPGAQEPDPEWQPL